jgi:hypothetical protein
LCRKRFFTEGGILGEGIMDPVRKVLFIKYCTRSFIISVHISNMNLLRRAR